MSAITKRIKPNTQRTHYKRADGTCLCFFCKRELDRHARCHICAILLHTPRAKVPDIVKTSERFYNKRLCLVCAKRRKPQRLMEDIADFLGIYTPSGVAADLPDLY